MQSSYTIDQYSFEQALRQMSGSEAFDRNSSNISFPIGISTNAHAPLSRIDFRKLVNIHDHEEHFLQMHFYRGLAQAYLSRISEGSTVRSITKADVRSAMIAVGTAAQVAPTSNLEPVNKALISSICPYCV